MEQSVTCQRLDRRTARTRTALREALAAEIAATKDLTQVTVTAVTDRAGITRRTFYSHYRDIPSMVCALEDEAVSDLKEFVQDISSVNLDELEDALNHFSPCPGSEDVLSYLQENSAHLAALLGEGGDPAFAEKIKAMVREVVQARAQEGFSAPASSSIAHSVFDYYLTFVISAEVGVVVRWLTTGMNEPIWAMSRMMTALLFVRPGDLYGRPINFDIPTLVERAKEFGEELTDVC